MIKRMGLVGLVGLWCLPGAAQQWESVGGRNAVVELDRASVVSVETGFQAWSRTTQPQQTLGPEEGFFYRRLLQLNEFQCGDRTFAPLQRMFFNDAGLLVKEERFPDPDELERVVPGSVEDRLYQNLCKNFKPANSGDSALAAAPSPGDRVRASAREKNALLARAETPAPAPATPGAQTPTQGQAQAGTAAGSQTATASAARPQPSATAEKPASSTTAQRTGGGISGFLSRMLPIKSAQPKAEPTPSSKPVAISVAPKKPAPVIVGQAASPAPAPKVEPPTKAKPQTKAGSQPVAAPKPQPNAAPAVAVDQMGRPTGSLPWLYDLDSPKGPKQWANLSPANSLCSKGLSQSPIDIRTPIVAEMAPIRFDYRAMPLKVTDTGTTIRVDVEAGSSLTWQGTRYDLLYYTFHHPSEMQVDGKSYDMSVHLVHRSVQGKLTVLAVPIRVGAANPTVQRLWNNLPLEMQVALTPPNVVLNPAGFLPVQKGYYAFVGSLSTPPCTEGVLWLVMKNPIEISAAQLNDFTRLYRHNVRPIQPSRGRLIKATRY